MKQYYEEVRRRKEEEEAAAAAAELVVREPRPKKKRVYQFPEFESMPGKLFFSWKFPGNRSWSTDCSVIGEMLI